jgi:hypothetical protein
MRCISSNAEMAGRTESSRRYRRRYLKMKEAGNPTPASWKSGNLSYGSRLTLSVARKMLEAGEKEAERQGVPMSMAISDAGAAI